MHWLGLTVALLALVSAGLATDYCNSSLCPFGTTHIACNNNRRFASTCPANARMIDIKPHINLLVNRHNNIRNRIAGGNIAGYNPARRMATIRWGIELAAIAALNVKRCIMKHDQCRNTDTFSKSGQNLAIMTYSGDSTRLTNNFLIRTLVQAWINEYKNARMEYINSYPAGYSGPPIGHFTVMVTDRNIRMGCAASRFTKTNGNSFLLACNYATTNIIGRAVYASGPAASGCVKGRNSVFTNLCALGEGYSGL